MKSKICPICGTEFTPKSNNSKYCSDNCRKVGRKVNRKNWELKTEYREKQKEKAAEYRKKRKAENQAPDQENKKGKTTKKTSTKAKEKKTESKPRSTIDLLAAEIGRAGNIGIEYWRAFKNYEIEFAEEAGTISKTEVNGISVYNGDFENLVIESIKERGVININ